MTDLKERLASVRKAREDAGKVPVKKANRKPVVMKGKKMLPLYENWSDYFPKQTPSVKGSYERFMTTYSPEMSLMKEYLFEGHEKCFEGCSALLFDYITSLVENDELVTLFTDHPDDAVIPPLCWYILNEGEIVEYDLEAEADIVAELEGLGVNFEKVEFTGRENPNDGTEEEDEDEDEDEE